MQTLTILEPLSLSQVLVVLQPGIENSTWRVRAMEAFGPTAPRLYQLEQAQRACHTAELSELAAGLDQVIDGYFEAYVGNAETPWLRIRAVDGASWDVSSDNEEILEKVRRSFVRVHDAGDVGY